MLWFVVAEVSSLREEVSELQRALHGLCVTNCFLVNDTSFAFHLNKMRSQSMGLTKGKEKCGVSCGL